MTEQCENCKLIDERIEKWIDHVGCTQKKYQRYDAMLDFVKSIAKCKIYSLAVSIDMCVAAREFLKDIGEND